MHDYHRTGNFVLLEKSDMENSDNKGPEKSGI